MEIIDRKSAKALNLRRYFTGKPCKHGHVTTRWVHNSACAACVNLASLRWSKLRPELMARRRQAWRKNNPEKEKINRNRSNAKYYAKPENKARAAFTNATVYYRNRKKILARKREYYRENREEILEGKRQWARANPEVFRIASRNRKARKRGADGSYTAADVAALYQLQSGRCACGCNEPLKKKYHVDHIVPLILGGNNYRQNLQLLRPECNLSKGPKDPIVWAQENGRLL